MRNSYRFWWANMKKRDRMERLMHKWQYTVKIYFKISGRYENVSSGFGCCEHGGESPGFI
jgi:hypothetical protein